MVERHNPLIFNTTNRTQRKDQRWEESRELNGAYSTGASTRVNAMVDAFERWKSGGRIFIGPNQMIPLGSEKMVDPGTKIWPLYYTETANDSHR